MKSRTLMCVFAITLFAALAIPVQLAAQHRRYKLIDLGTFGGAISYLPNDFTGTGLGIPQLINNRGMVVGAADTSTPNPTHGIGSGFFPDDPVIVHAFQWQKGVLNWCAA